MKCGIHEWGIMTLPVPYMVYGHIYNSNGTVADGAGVNAQDITAGGAFVNTTTDANGRYQLNLQTIATDGNTIRVNASRLGATNTTTFVLDISYAAKLINLTLGAVAGTDLSLDLRNRVPRLRLGKDTRTRIK